MGTLSSSIVLRHCRHGVGVLRSAWEGAEQGLGQRRLWVGSWQVSGVTWQGRHGRHPWWWEEQQPRHGRNGTSLCPWRAS